MQYYTIQNNGLLIADNQQALTKFYDNVFPLPEDYEDGKYIIVNGVLVLNPNWDEEHLREVKQAKYNEANNKAREYLETGSALFEFEKDENIYHIEATDGNIAKIGLKATALLLAQDYTTTFPWNTKEDININLNALEGKAIAEGLGAIQDEVWTVKFPYYITLIDNATTVNEVEAIVIDYAPPTEEVEE